MVDLLPDDYGEDEEVVYEVRLETESGEVLATRNLSADGKWQEPIAEPDSIELGEVVTIETAFEIGVEPTPVVPGQESLFGGDEEFHRHWQEWQGMPAYESKQISPHSSILVHFMSREDREVFAKLVDQPISPLTRSLYYPRMEWDQVADLRWRSVNEPADKERRDKGNSGSLYGKGGKA